MYHMLFVEVDEIFLKVFRTITLHCIFEKTPYICLQVIFKILEVNFVNINEYNMKLIWIIILKIIIKIKFQMVF